MIHTNKSTIPPREGRRKRAGLAGHLETAKAHLLDGRSFAAWFKPLDPRRSERLHGCHTDLTFREYFNRPGKPVKLANANHCYQHLLCRYCAAGRCSRCVMKYRERIETAREAEPDLVPYLVTLTCEGMADLPAMVKRITDAWSKLVRKRRKGRGCHSVMGRFAGGFISVEVKRGEGGLWHVHLHGIILGPGGLYQPIWEALVSEWWEALGQEARPQVWFKPIRNYTDRDDLTKGLMEVIKYCVKPDQNQSYRDRWDAAKALRGKRCLRSFGVLYSPDEPDEPDDLCDDLTEEEEEEFRELRYRYLDSHGAYVRYRTPGERFEEFEEYSGPMPESQYPRTIEACYNGETEAKNTAYTEAGSDQTNRPLAGSGAVGLARCGSEEAGPLPVVPHQRSDTDAEADPRTET